MSSTTFRAGAGLTAALALAAFAWPAAGDAAPADDTVRTAGASEPVIVGSVDESAVRSAHDVLQGLGDQIAAEAVAAQQARDLEALAAAEDAASSSAWPPPSRPRT